jgi:hypothetical protein
MPTIAGLAIRYVAAVKLPCICAGSADYNYESFGTPRWARWLAPRVTNGFEEILMNTKLFASTIVAASLLASPVAFAQAETAAPPPGAAEGNNMQATPPAAQHNMKSSQIKSSQSGHFQQGTTTGLGSQGAARARPGGQSVARKPAD